MRTTRILLRMVLMAGFLAGCTAPAARLSGSPVSTVASATSTPFLPAGDTPVPASATSSPALTGTATLTPTPAAAPSLRVNLEAVGDIMLARTVGDQVLAAGPGIVFAGVQSAFDSADILMGNLECALTTGGQPQDKSFTFAAPPQAAQALGLAGFDVLSLANNHAMDYGSQGLLDTRQNLGQAGVASVGAGKNATEAHAPVLLERNGLRLAFLAYVDVPVEKGGFDTRAWIATATQPGVAWADLEQIKADVSSARTQADLVIVQLHSGYEISSYIPPISTDQRLEAYAAIDAGAALVIGSHSHVLEPIEKYHGGLIAFSLGNFVFDGYWGVVNASIILRVVLTRAGVESYDWVPVLIEKGLPLLATDQGVPAIGTLVAPRVSENPMTIFTPRPAQSKILAYTGGKMGISAVPGSGKTHTLSALAAQLIRSGALGEEQEVLIVTLVNSAVDNFASRIKEFLELPMPFGYRVRTLHGLAHDIVREKPAAVGLEERFSIIDDRDAAFILKEAATAWLAANPDFLLANYLKPDLDDYQLGKARREGLPELVTSISNAFIRSAKDNRLTPEKLASLLDQAPAPLPLAAMGLAIYSNYQRALAYRGAVDFDDLIRLAIDLLESDAEFLERLRYRWPYILEDEAQDSSRLQEQILRLLAGGIGNWVRVGDPNQAIFETFTTASPQHLLDFIKDEADAYETLPNSGRSQPSIIVLANQLITWVNGEHPEQAVRDALTVPFILPAPEGDPQPNPPDGPQGVKLIWKKYSPAEEVEAVVKSIERWLPDHQDSTVAVLVPRNQRGTDVIDLLKLHNIDFVELLGSTLSTRKAAGRLGDIVSALADPQSASRLAKAYLAWRREDEEETNNDFQRQVAELIRKCSQVETFVSPKTGRDWLADLEPEVDKEAFAELDEFRALVRRWQGTTVLPIDQMILTLSQDLFTAPVDLALAHKLALALRQVSEDHRDWRLPELTGELTLIARNERRFLGFSEDDSGFDPSHHAGKVVVTTMHKAKGLEWDRVYLMSVNNYDFPSGLPGDRYIPEKWFVRDGLNLEAETLAQLDAALATGEYDFYTEGAATRSARQDYVRERLRLLYVGITRAKKELLITWNTGRQGEQTQAIPFANLQGWWESRV